MTKKDYELIADAISGAVWKIERAGVFEEQKLGMQRVAIQIAFALEQDNPKFDKHKFFDACGIE